MTQEQKSIATLEAIKLYFDKGSLPEFHEAIDRAIQALKRQEDRLYGR